MVGEYAMGRPRKPLAEVLLGAPRCAPLRLALLVAHGVPFGKCLITNKASCAALVVISLGAGKIYPGV